jgi:hypothetical protein
LDVEIKRWAAGKEGNLRALLSTLQYVRFFFFWIIYDHIQHNTYVENNLWITFTKWVFPYPLLISFIPKKKHALYLVHQY